MDRVIREFRDPAGIALAVITGVVNWRLGVRVGLAVGAALAVLAVRTAAALLWPSNDSVTNAAPAAEPPDLPELVGSTWADLLQHRADQLSQDQAAELTESLQGRAIGGAVLLALAGLFVYLHGLTLVNLLWLIGLGFYLYG